MKLLLLDLDGTLRKPKSEATFINQPYDQVIIPQAQAALANYKDWVKVGITNQLGVAKGYKTLEDCISEQKYTMKLLSLELTKHTHYQLPVVYFCPDEGDTCYKVYCGTALSIIWNREDRYDSFRKPGAGMIQLALDSCNGETIEEVLMVGDRTEDQQAAAKAGVNFMWAEDL